MFPMATIKRCHPLGHFSSQAHTAQLPFNSSSGWNLYLYVSLMPGIPAEGHQGVRARWESNTIPVNSWGEQPVEQDHGTHRGTNLLHSFEAHGVDSLTVQFNTPEEGKEAALCQIPYYERLSAAATTESTFFPPTGSYPSKSKLLKLLLKQLPTHLPMLWQLSYRTTSPTTLSAALQSATLQRLSFRTFKRNSTIFKPTFCCIFFTKWTTKKG